MQLNLSFTEGFAKIDIIGIPDHSLGQGPDTIGILLLWRLNLIGYSVLEGKKDNLDNFLYVVYTYARYCIGGTDQSVSDHSNSITMSRHVRGHEIKLISKQKSIDPLSLVLDDAEFSDLIKCLDHISSNKRIAIKWDIPLFKSLSEKQLRPKLFVLSKFLYPLTGSALLVAASSLLFLVSPTFRNDQLPNVSNETININDK